MKRHYILQNLHARDGVNKQMHCREGKLVSDSSNTEKLWYDIEADSVYSAVCKANAIIANVSIKRMQTKFISGEWRFVAVGGREIEL